MAQTRAELIAAIAADPWIGHQLFFGSRYGAAPADFHADMARDFWFGERRRQIMAFRGCGKSTIAESNIVLAGAMRTFRNILIVGASEVRAVDRMLPISYQLMMNTALLEVFGPQRGSHWTQTKIVLSSGYCIQAMGRDQDVRGLKHMDWRPDFVLVDDFEDKESVQTPAQRDRTYDWFLAELMLALQPDARILILGTPLDEDSVPMRLKAAGWPTRVVPIEYLDEKGERRPAWPNSPFSLKWIDQNRELYRREGKLRLWDAEMMMQPRGAGSQTFRKETFRVAPRLRSWHATYAMIDPARTVRVTSATTGWAVWSWIGRRLVVWAAGADLLLPDEIVDLAFTICEGFDPVWIGVEKDGLDQFLLQPLRQEQVRRGVLLPVRPLRAPKSKLDFIRGLQPFFEAGEVEFAVAMPELEEQLLGFPTGRIDAPNALAYALLLRPGRQVFEAFGDDHVARHLEVLPTRDLWLAANADHGVTAAALCQHVDGQVRVLADWLVEGVPAEAVPRIAAEAALAGDVGQMTLVRPDRRNWSDVLKVPERVLGWEPRAARWLIPPAATGRWTNVGLAPAIAAVPAECLMGAEPERGRRVLGDLLTRRSGGAPLVSVSERAEWTLRAFAGGFCYPIERSGRAGGEPEEGPYRVLMEGLEAFAGRMATAQLVDDAAPSAQNYAYDRAGRRYLSAMPQRG